jgi:1,4-alpha-glucan branching enzyme
MGNEFGHPEWIDFPREGNNWSFRYARRQWNLVDDPNLKYQFLARFDRDMIGVAKAARLFHDPWPHLLREHNDNKIIAFERSGLVFAFNFHPTASYFSYRFQAPPGTYRIILDSDSSEYGGHGRIAPEQEYDTRFERESDRNFLSLYLPARTALVLALQQRSIVAKE